MQVQRLQVDQKLRVFGSLLGCFVLIRVLSAIVYEYRNYFPPNFSADFLLGRRSYFYGFYSLAFYTHILSGPLAILGGLFLIPQRFRVRYSMAHRIVGRVQVLLILLVSLSGSLMACYTDPMWPAGTSFAVLSIVTFCSGLLGLKAILNRQVRSHQTWMQRSYALLCSAIVLRVMGGITTATGLSSTSWSYSLTAWASWLVPLVAFEWVRTQMHYSRVISSPPAMVFNAATSESGVESSKK